MLTSEKAHILSAGGIMKSSSAMNFPQSRSNITRSYSDSDTVVTRILHASSTQIDAPQHPPQPQLPRGLISYAFLFLFSTKNLVGAFGYWMVKMITACIRHICDWNTVFGMFVAYTLYINMEESLNLNTTEDILAIADEPSTFEWEEIRQCQNSLDSLQDDYLVLYKQIKPIQDAVEAMKAEMRNIMQLAQGAAHSAVKQVIQHKQEKGELTEQEVTGIVNNAMKTVHDNYTRIANYALKSARANIVRSRTSEGYKKNLAQMRWHNFALWSFTSNPDVILEPDVYPGNCWPFPSAQGQILVKLAEKIQPAAVTLHHIAMEIPRLAEISSAPKDFAIYGLNEEDEENGTFLGQFTYNSEGEPIQTFPLEENKTNTFQYIRLRVLSNWGNPDYTCIYRFRVHRDLPHQELQRSRQRVANNA